MSFIILIISVVIGVLIVVGLKPAKNSIQLLLSFSGAYLLSITVLHLLPEVFETQQSNIGLFILLGILFQTILEFFSKGAEHGHLHVHSNVKNIPWLLFVSLSLHAFFEGIPLGTEASNLLLWAIVIHKIPISIVLIIFFKQSKLSNQFVLAFIIAFALMSPLGLLISSKIDFFNTYHIEITAIIVGVFLHISTAILFESTQNHQFNIRKFIAILIGFTVAFLSTLLVSTH